MRPTAKQPHQSYDFIGRSFEDSTRRIKAVNPSVSTSYESLPKESHYQNPYASRPQQQQNVPQQLQLSNQQPQTPSQQQSLTPKENRGHSIEQLAFHSSSRSLNPSAQNNPSSMVKFFNAAKSPQPPSITNPSPKQQQQQQSSHQLKHQLSNQTQQNNSLNISAQNASLSKIKGATKLEVRSQYSSANQVKPPVIGSSIRPLQPQLSRLPSDQENPQKEKFYTPKEGKDMSEGGYYQPQNYSITAKSISNSQEQLTPKSTFNHSRRLANDSYSNATTKSRFPSSILSSSSFSNGTPSVSGIQVSSPSSLAQAYLSSTNTPSSTTSKHQSQHGYLKSQHEPTTTTSVATPSTQYSQQYYKLQSQAVSGFQQPNNLQSAQNQIDEPVSQPSVGSPQIQHTYNSNQNSQTHSSIRPQGSHMYSHHPSISLETSNHRNGQGYLGITSPNGYNSNPYSVTKKNGIENQKGLTIDSNINYSSVGGSSAADGLRANNYNGRNSIDPYNLNIFSNKSVSRDSRFTATVGATAAATNVDESEAKPSIAKVSSPQSGAGQKMPSSTTNSSINSTQNNLITKTFLSPQAKSANSVSIFETSRSPQNEWVNSFPSSLSSRVKPFQQINDQGKKQLLQVSNPVVQPDSTKSGLNKSTVNLTTTVLNPTHSLKQSYQFSRNSSPIRRDKTSVSSHLSHASTTTYDAKQQSESMNLSSSVPDNLSYESTNWSQLGKVNADLIERTMIPNHEKTKFSIKRNGIVKSYAANTNQGLVRNYNEDRVSIILNITKPQQSGKEGDDKPWPKCSFFGVYDGHGGVACADFLRDNLHQFVIKDSSFPHNPRQAIINGFASAEKTFLDSALQKEKEREKPAIEKSGSCAIVVMIVGTRCYVANVGDSRAIMSGGGGTQAYDLSRDHKPLDEIESKRIALAGGKIYQQFDMSYLIQYNHLYQKNQDNELLELISHESNTTYVWATQGTPRKAVTRTFGDIEAKLPRLGGNPNVVVATPDIKEFDITDNLDFILLACDGIFDKLSTKETIDSIWYEAKGRKPRFDFKNVHEFCGVAVDTALKFAIGRKTMDNVTVVVIGFDNLKRCLFGANSSNVPSNTIDDRMQEVANEGRSVLSINQIPKHEISSNSLRMSLPNSMMSDANNRLTEAEKQHQRTSAEYSSLQQVRQNNAVSSSIPQSNTLSGRNSTATVAPATIEGINNNNNLSNSSQFNFKYKTQYLSDTLPNYTGDSRYAQLSYSKH